MAHDDDEDDDSSEGKKRKPPIFFMFKGTAIGIYSKSFKRWEKDEFYNGSRTVYTINLYLFDGEEKIIEYFEEKNRNAEYENFLDKLREQGIILI